MKSPRISLLLAVALFTAMAGLTPSASATATWTHSTHMLSPRTQAGGATIGTKVFALGGWTGTQRVGTGEYLRQSDKTWHSIATLPGPGRQEFGTAVVKGKLYVVGGLYNDGSSWVNLRDLDVFNPTSGTWKQLAPLPVALDKVAATGFSDGKLYVFGGNDDPGTFDGAVSSVFAYTPASDTWKALANMPTPRMSPGVVAAVNNIYVIGGSASDGSQLAVNEQFTPSTDHWATKTAMAIARSRFAIGLAGDGRIYVAGGFNWAYGLNGSGVMDQVESYSPTTDIWRAAPSLPAARSDAASAVFKGKLYVMGGIAPDSTVASTVFVMTP